MSLLRNSWFPMAPKEKTKSHRKPGTSRPQPPPSLPLHVSSAQAPFPTHPPSRTLPKLPHSQPLLTSLYQKCLLPPFLPQALLNLPATYDFVHGLFYHDRVTPDVFAYMSFYLPTELGALWGQNHLSVSQVLIMASEICQGIKHTHRNSDLESSLVTLPSASVAVNL